MTLEEALAVVSHYSYLHRSSGSKEERAFNTACGVIREKAKEVAAREVYAGPAEDEGPSWPIGDRNHLKAGNIG